MIYIVGVIITFFLSIILLTKRQKSMADKILFTWLCVILVQLILFALISSKEYLRFPYLLGLDIPLPLLHGPFLFLYTSALTNGRATTTKILLHFVPYVLALLSIIPFLLLSLEDKISIYQNEGKGYETLSTIIFLGIILSGITYTILSLSILIKHKKEIKDNYSYTEKVNLEWLVRLIIGLSCVWLLVFFADDAIIFASVVLFVLFIGYYGIKQVGIFTNQALLNVHPYLESKEPIRLSVSPSENSKYEKSSLTDEQVEYIHRKLVLLMNKKKLYLISELTLAMVSLELDVHPNTLSQVINKIEQKNFFDYINSLRVVEFKERATKPENEKYTLLSLAYECGFNSKTSFNRNFKNITGQSPSEYLKESKSTLY